MPNEIDTRTHVFDFGQYKDYSYKYVFNKDPWYIEWCSIDRGILALDENDMADLEEQLRIKGK